MRITSITLVTFLSLFLIGCTQDYQPIDDAEIVVRLVSEPDKLSALYAAGRAEDARVASQIYQTLLEYDPVTLEIVPVVVESRPIISPITEGQYKGGSSHSYKIREEASWSDGSPVLAEDFYFTLKTIVNPKSSLSRIAPIIEFVKEMKLDPEDPKKFVAYGDARHMLEEMALGNMPVIPKHILDPNGVLDSYTLEDLRNPEVIAGPDNLNLIDIGAKCYRFIT